MICNDGREVTPSKSRIGFTADLHLGHANIIKYSERPFDSVEAHDRALIDNWTAHVTPRDVVYFLGGPAYRNRADTRRYLDRFAGQIFFIEGNHDAAAAPIRSSFAWHGDAYQLKTRDATLGDVRVFLNDHAHRVWPRSQHGAWHL